MKAIPNARRTEIVGWRGADLKVKVQAPALDGRANEALCDAIARELGIRGSAVTLVRGAASRTKLVEVRGLSLGVVQSRLPGA